MFRLIHQLIPRVKRVIIALMTWRVVEWVDHMASARRPRGVKQEGGFGDDGEGDEEQRRPTCQRLGFEARGSQVHALLTDGPGTDLLGSIQ